MCMGILKPQQQTLRAEICVNTETSTADLVGRDLCQSIIQNTQEIKNPQNCVVLKLGTEALLPWQMHLDNCSDSLKSITYLSAL